MSQDLLHRIPQWEREADSFERKAHALRQLIESVRVLNGDAARLFALSDDDPSADPPPKPDAEGPRGREAVRAIIAGRPGAWLVRDLKRINRENGWPSDDAGIETAVIRMARAGECIKIKGKRGFYDFPAKRGNQAASQPTLHRQEGEAA
jgi:hypothetical protein